MSYIVLFAYLFYLPIFKEIPMLLDRLVLKVLVPVLLAAWGSVALADVPVAASDADSEEVECFPRTQTVLQAPEAKHTPPAESDCPPLSPERIKLVEDWRRPAQQIQLLSRPEGDAPIPVGIKVKLTLLPSEKVSLVVQEEELKTVKYAGLLTFRTGKAGGYRFLTTPYVWLELVPIGAPDQKAYASSTDRRFKCYDIKKNIIFNNLSADTRYWLQISGSPLDEVEMLIAAPEPE